VKSREITGEYYCRFGSEFFSGDKNREFCQWDFKLVRELSRKNENWLDKSVEIYVRSGQLLSAIARNHYRV
jgi:hypothetical protein